jgi:O-antigen ligase
MATILALQVLINFADDVWIRIATGQWPIAESIITGTKTGMSYVTNLLMAFLVAEGVFRITRHQRLLPIGNYSVLILFLFSLFTTLLLDARNGTVGVIFLLLSAVLLTWFEYRHRISKLRLGLGLTVVIIGIAAFATATVKMDPTHRWQTFVQTIPIAWDTEHNKAWLDRDKYPYPTLPNGQMVSPSNYERIAWFKEACIMIGEHPWGMGFGRLAFGHALYEIYGEEGYHHHAHSAVLDFTIGTGIPGILLWLVFIGSAFMMAWRGYFKTHIPEALILLFIITGFFGRSLDDGNMRDHMMEQFMFLLGLFLTMVQGKVSSTTSTEQS